MQNVVKDITKSLLLLKRKWNIFIGIIIFVYQNCRIKLQNLNLFVSS